MFGAAVLVKKQTFSFLPSRCIPRGATGGGVKQNEWEESTQTNLERGRVPRRVAILFFFLNMYIHKRK
jgi:hypothetical protein